MTLRCLALLAVRLLALNVLAVSVEQLGRSGWLLNDLSYEEAVKGFLCWTSSGVLLAAVLWFLAGYISRFIFPESDQAKEVSASLTVDGLFRIFCSLIGLKLFIYAVPIAIGNAVQLYQGRIPGYYHRSVQSAFLISLLQSGLGLYLLLASSQVAKIVIRDENH